MAEVRIHVHTPSGDSHPIDAPTDIRAEAFIREVVDGLNLPKVDAEGHPVNWTIDDKDTGKTLDYQSTLEAAGVQNGHHLYMRRQVVAGAASR